MFGESTNKQLEIHIGDGCVDCAQKATYDTIIITAAAEVVPNDLLN